MDFSSLEKTVICTALENDLSRREELVERIQNWPDDEPRKATLLQNAIKQLAAARSAYKKLQ
ncbi:hypothetical protein [Paenibacillus mesotrionivorans]|uniref:Uncharacterized protein n=1 Tax=Paenibacillus mesotrionivorans TaxID=3160968 RepID=A0ACC7NW83_9BACL